MRQGPALGPIRLLAPTSAGFAPRPVEDLNAALSSVFEREFDCAGTSVRSSLKGKSFDEQWEEGLKIMRKVGILE
jgi:hypothetical protein